MTEATAIQTKPKGMADIDIASLVKEDIESRAGLGLVKYGERLRPFNGRDPMIDLYQEMLDMVMYMRQYITERKLTENLRKE